MYRVIFSALLCTALFSCNQKKEEEDFDYEQIVMDEGERMMPKDKAIAGDPGPDPQEVVVR